LSRYTFCVCTYNSAKTLNDCLKSIRNLSTDSRVIIVDHNSQDDTLEVASRYSTEVHKENKGLGFARQLCFDLVDSDLIVFVDSDVEITRRDFLDESTKVLADGRYGAVVGMPLGHKFAFGLPASLLVLRKSDFEGKTIPSYIDARETYFIQRRLDDLGLRTYYLPDAIVHRSQFRRHKPEWEGANTRILPSSKPGELAFALKVVLLMSLNSRQIKNIAYVPIFYLKFLVGFNNPGSWLRLKRK
jgi:glycosyltransferase involved in cell wall biosynthesis